MVLNHLQQLNQHYSKMDYPELIIQLERFHLYPSKIRSTPKGKIMGLELNTIDILKDSRQQWIENNIQGVKVDWEEEQGYLLLTLKK